MNSLILSAYKYIMTIGIIGHGFVGKATFQLASNDIDVIAYDKSGHFNCKRVK